MAFSQKYVGTGLAILGIIIAVGGIIGFFIIGHGIDMGLRDIKVLTNTSSAFQGWSSNVPGSNPNDPNNNNIVPITMQFTLFNLTNKADVLTGSIPIYQKVGPYVYQEYQLRFDANFTDNGNLVSFYESRYYVFDRANTDASLDPATDAITAFNPIYTGVINTGGGSESSFYNFSIGQGLGALNAQLLTLVPPLAQALWSSTLLPSDFKSLNISVADWVNATTLPGNAQAYVISSGGVPSGISATSAAALRNLFSSVFTASKLNDILTSDKAGLADLMQTAPDLTPQQASMFINWYRTWAAGYLVTFIETKISGSFKDIPYLQWGQGSTLPLPFSLQFFAKQAGINLPGPPEFFYALNPHTSMGLADVKNLMDPNTNPNAVTVGNNWMLFMSYANKSDWNSIVNTWNLSSVAVAQNMTTYINYFVNTFIVQPVEGALNGNGGLISTRTVNQWLWSYQDPLLVALQQPVTNGALFVNDTSLDFVRETTGLNIQYTGLNDTTVAQSFYQWNGTTTLTGIWNSTEVVNGTEGNNFPPDLDVTDSVYVWDSTTLRKAAFVANETVTVKSIQLLRYRISPDMFNTSAKYYQSIYGFANMSSAYSNASLFISKPHFFQSAGDYLNKIQILNYTGPPNQDNDDIYLDVEPISGVTMNEVKQLQINVYIKSNSSFDYFGRYGGVNSDVMQPVFIAQELQQVTDYLANTFVSQVYTFENVKKIILWSLLGAGMLLLLVGCLLVIFGSKTEYESI